jgi:probable O-glycosylation ligase (exosortase A-associated)
MLYSVANDRPTGAGFEPYTRAIYDRYVPEAPEVRAAHSIYFQVLGEQGWLGIFLFLLMWLLSWRSTRVLIKITASRNDLQWVHQLTRMIQVSIIGYLVGGAFLNLAYWDLPYYLIVLLVVMRHIVERELRGKTVAAPVRGAAAMPGGVQLPTASRQRSA